MKVRIHYSFLILLLLSLFTSQFIPFLIFFISILLHELSHLLWAKKFNQKIVSITITALGGIIDISFRKISKFKLLIIQFAGTLTNGIIYLIVYNGPSFKYQEMILNFNLILIIFNSLPIFPLDGYLILTNILSMFCKFQTEYMISLIISFFCLIVLSFYAFKLLSIALIIIVIYLLYKNIMLSFQRDYYLLQRIIQRN
ncbi:MAG TPA: site-2 protease family protein [Bacilli bacterium]|nr:site-2 protease family protein [Bacilli bacterium]